MSDNERPDPGAGFADRLGHWLGWTDAIALAAVLDAGAASGAPHPGPLPPAGDGASVGSIEGASAERECARLRAALTHRAAAALGAAPLREDEIPALRRRHLAAQQAMASAIAPLRARLRTALAARSPAHAQLAAVDAVLEKALAPHERRLLAGVPALLERHNERLRRTLPSIRPAGWLDAFGRDVQAALLAELELRMQPIDGLLSALRTPKKP